VAWWYAPVGVGFGHRLYENYRQYISQDLEPTLQIPGATFVGVNTSHGITLRTLTWNARDLSIIGDVTPDQVATMRTRLAKAPRSDIKVAVMHHNPVKGELSQRYGLKHSKRLLDTLGEIGVDLVLCGHDHQEAVTLVERERNGIVVSTAGTVSNRSRGGRPSSYNLITVTDDSIQVVTHIWSTSAHDFLPGPTYNFARSVHALTD
jgi:3',5'-cyclic AMP phosphodiesterase CpdA